MNIIGPLPLIASLANPVGSSHHSLPSHTCLPSFPSPHFSDLGVKSEGGEQNIKVTHIQYVVTK
jgi:hypothetical protein